jgi:hypothetical protein
MRRQAAGQGLFEAMVVIACAALLLLGVYALIANRHGVGRDSPGNIGGKAPSARLWALSERSSMAGAGGAGAADGLTQATEGI